MRSNNYFQNIYIEIVGFCNAKCPYCTTGAKNAPCGGLMKHETFSDVIQMLLKNKLADKNSLIHLYNWGEPFLHPTLKNLVEIINVHGLKYALSTNSSRLPVQIDREFSKNLKQVIYSMPGFSQDSYDKIHGFNFDRIIKNIANFTNCVRHHNEAVEFLISYHVYRFNYNEMKACEKFADNFNIEFSPRYALLNDWWQLEKYLAENKNSEKIERDIFISNIRETMSKIPNQYKCPQYKGLTIDEVGNILTCCVLPRNHPDYSCGNLLTDNIEFVLNSRPGKKVCKYCINTGLAGYLNDLKCPREYKKSAKQLFLPLHYDRYRKFLANLCPEILLSFFKKFKG